MLKPVTEASNKMSAYVTDHMVDLTPAQIDGLKKKTEEWDPKIVQINVAEANIVDRCESCHMNTREPLHITAAVMDAKGEKHPDEYARAFTSHPDPELLKTHDPDKFGCSPCHQGNGRATTSVEKAHGNYEHWLWPLFPRQNVEAGCQNCHAADMRLVIGDVGQHISDGQIPVPPARLHGLPSLRRLRQGTGGSDLDCAADEAAGSAEDRQCKALRLT